MPPSCDRVSDRLVDYADGELSPGKSAEVAEHLAACEGCRATVRALRRSLDLARAIWQDAEADLAGVRPPTFRARRFRPSRLIFAAASILLIAAGSLILGLALRRGRPSDPAQDELTLAAIERSIARTAVAAQLLVSADLLAEQPGGEAIATEQYRYVVAAYPDTESAAKAELRLRSRIEGREPE